MMSSDSPIVDEVRQRAMKISERFNHDLRRYGQHLMEEQKKYKDKLVNQIAIIKSDGRNKKAS